MLINGAPGDTVRADDRGLLYGDGVFETMAVSDGRVPLWSRHRSRLELGCRTLGFAAPPADLLERELGVLCRGAARSVAKLIVTRGAGTRGYRPPRAPQPTRILSLHPWPDHPVEWCERGIVARLCDTRLARNCRLAGLKHLNRLEQVLARAEWDDAHIAEGIVLDEADRVIGGTMSNLFIAAHGELMTPDLSHCGVAGIMRGMILERLRGSGTRVAIAGLSLADVTAADEAFVCNAVIGVWPLRRLAQRDYGTPGPLTCRCREIAAQVLR